MSDQEPVDAGAYATKLERLDRIGREALAADPAEAIGLVREANDLVAELLPMHRQLMQELATHRETLQAACDELASAAPTADADDADDGGDGGAAPATPDGTKLDRLDGIGDDEDVPF